MKKRTKQKILQISVVVLIIAMTFGGVGGTLFYLIYNQQQLAAQQATADQTAAALEALTADSNPATDASQPELGLTADNDLVMPAQTTTDQLSNIAGIETLTPEQRAQVEELLLNGEFNLPVSE